MSSEENRQRYVVLDVETTGLYPRFGDRICEIGLVLAQGDQIEATYSSLVNPQRPISAGASAVNGLSDEMLADAPLFAEIADEILARLEKRVFICHNAPFDLGFLVMELSRLGKPVQFDGVIDTLTIARNFGWFRSNSLGAIASQLELDVKDTHRALADALTTFKVWQYFRHTLNIEAEQFIQTFYPQGQLVAEIQIPLLIKEAIEQQIDIEILYLDRNGTETRRLIRPEEVFVVSDTVYLAAYCHLRQDKRNFRLDRIISILSGR